MSIQVKFEHRFSNSVRYKKLGFYPECGILYIIRQICRYNFEGRDLTLIGI